MVLSTNERFSFIFARFVFTKFAECGETKRRVILFYVPDILEDLGRGTGAAAVSARFHNTLAEAILLVARAVGQSTVALTGGCFQNELLVERTTRQLRADGFEVLLHRQLPPNDGGISPGQIAVAAAGSNG